MKKMRKITLIVGLLCSMVAVGFAQKVALVNAQQLLDALPEYKEAKEELDQLTSQWESDIQGQYDDLDEMYRKFDAEQVLLDENMKKEKQDELYKKEQEIRTFQLSKFGPEGDLFQKRITLIEPIQEKVYMAIEKFADDNGIDIILDRNGSAGVLFANNQYDVTSQIIKTLKN